MDCRWREMLLGLALVMLGTSCAPSGTGGSDIDGPRVFFEGAIVLTMNERKADILAAEGRRMYQFLPGENLDPRIIISPSTPGFRMEVFPVALEDWVACDVFSRGLDCILEDSAAIGSNLQSGITYQFELHEMVGLNTVFEIVVSD